MMRNSDNIKNYKFHSISEDEEKFDSNNQHVTAKFNLTPKDIHDIHKAINKVFNYFFIFVKNK